MTPQTDLPSAMAQAAGSSGFFRLGRALWAASIVWTFLAGGPAIASELKSDEQLILYPALARRTSAGCELELHGLVYEPGRHRLMARVLRRSLGIDEEDITPTEASIFNERIEYFLVDNERGKKFDIQIGGVTRKLNASAANGHFSTSVSLAADALPPEARHGGDARFILQAQFPEAGGQVRRLPLQVLLLSDTGFSVISDIDDTIKVSEVRDRQALVRNTFCRPFQLVPGMAEIYQSWAGRAGAQFHYLTASPWQLYLPLSEFVRSNGFPAGTFFMKDFRVKDSSFFQLFTSPERYKPDVIERLLRQFPRRQFVLVGDSGEKDPEIYASVARRHRQQICAIFIRDVTNEPGASVRHQKTFTGLAPQLWRVFKEAGEIGALLPCGAEAIPSKVKVKKPE